MSSQQSFRDEHDDSGYWTREVPGILFQRVVLRDLPMLGRLHSFTDVPCCIATTPEQLPTSPTQTIFGNAQEPSFKSACVEVHRGCTSRREMLQEKEVKRASAGGNPSPHPRLQVENAPSWLATYSYPSQSYQLLFRTLRMTSKLRQLDGLAHNGTIFMETKV